MTAPHPSPLAPHRLDLAHVGRSEGHAAFLQDVRHGLMRPRKMLPCQYFYDELGSKLFEEICALEEYYLPRAEREILETCAPDLAAVPATLVELGSGSSTKTRILIEAMLQRHGRLLYVPIDVSHTMLEDSAHALVRDYRTLEVAGIAAEYTAGIAELSRRRLGPKLILWLGSNIGNFDREHAAAFLRSVRDAMLPGDRLLVGADLRKHKRILEAAYDDARGVTAAFNKNVLSRVNRELGADFDLDAFEHRAVYLEDVGKIEMHLVSTRAQRVTIPALELEVELERGEVIHTEDSYKYSHEEIEALAAASGLMIQGRWTDHEERFSETLFVR